MNTPSKLSGFVVGLTTVFGLTYAVGNVAGPVGGPAPAAAAHAGHDGPAAKTTTSTEQPGGMGAELPGGLMVSQQGYTLDLANTSTQPGDDVPVAFTIIGQGGEPVTDYQRVHEKKLHLIAVRGDLTGFQHVHPRLRDDGTWTTALDLTAGQWRLFADFAAAGADALTLGADLSVPGPYQPVSQHRRSRTAVVGDYTVTLTGDLRPGTDSKLRASVTVNGRPVTDLQPYLGAYGHLVALRAGDLAYLHVHPAGTPGDGATQPGPDVVFYAAVPSPGSYRLFLDFKHGGVVRTAAFTLATGTTGGASPVNDSFGGEHSDGHDGH